MILRQLGIALVIFLLSVSPVLAASPTVSDISKQFICQCGCNMVLSNCSHAECGSREAMKASIREYLSQGQSEPQIIQTFVTRYGEQVLAAPPKRGFNLMAWVTPFAGILLGGGVVYAALTAWVRRGRHYQASAETVADTGDEEYRHQLEKDLENFPETGFR